MVHPKNGQAYQADLKGRLERSLPAWYPAYSRPLGCRLVERKAYRWSEHLIFQVMEGKTPVRKILVKLPNTYSGGNRQQEFLLPAEDRVRLEYEALKLLYESLDGGKKDNVVAVRPLAHYSDMDALVLEYLPGTNFLSILKRAGAFFGKFSHQNSARDAAFDAGRLLAYMHQIPHGAYPETRPVDEIYLKRILDGKRERLLALYPAPQIEKQVLDIQKTMTGYFGKVCVEVVTTKLHGDYYPENVVRLPSGCVFTIDTPLYQVGPVEQDIAKFLAGTAMTKRYLLLSSVGMDKNVAFNINRAFLQGYQSIGKCDHRVLLAFQLSSILQRWIEVLEVMRNRLPHRISSTLNKIRITPLMLESMESLRKNMEVEM